MTATLPQLGGGDDEPQLTKRQKWAELCHAMTLLQPHEVTDLICHVLVSKMAELGAEVVLTLDDFELACGHDLESRSDSNTCEIMLKLVPQPPQSMLVLPPGVRR